MGGKTEYRVLRKARGENPLEIGIHKQDSHRIVVIYAGHGTTVNGRGNKYVKIADRLVEKGVGAVVHASDPRGNVEDLKTVLDYVKAHAKEICGDANPELYLGGHSAGANAASEVAEQYGVKRLLLVGATETTSMLRRFKGEVYVTIGKRDKFGTGASKDLYTGANEAAKRELVIVPLVEHGFHGPRSHLLYRKAFYWAFAGDIGYPSVFTRKAPDTGKTLA